MKKEIKVMRFMKPKEKKTQKTPWEVSERVIDLVKAYAEYTEYSEEEIVEYFLNVIQDDEAFRSWAVKKRNNKKLLKILELEEALVE
jgi:hypothetical protein